MRYETQTVRIGECVGPVDWEHPIAKDKPETWREAEKRPSDFQFITVGGFIARDICKIGMYDGWPYWKPTPAILTIGPLGPEWIHFNSYGVTDRSIFLRSR